MDDESFDQLLKSALARTPDQLADPHAPMPHPEPDVLQLHHAQELDAAQAKQVQEHIEACASCARQFLDFDVPPPIDPRDESFDVRAGWERLTQAAGKPTGVRAVAKPESSLASWFALWRWVLAPLATAAVAGVIGFQLGQQPGPMQPSTPTRRQMVEVTQLPGTTRSLESSAPIAEATLDEGVTLLVALRVLQMPAGDKAYDVRLFAAERPTSALLTRRVATSQQGGQIVVDIPPAAAPPGTYELWLYPAGQTDVLARYGLVLRAP